MNFFAFNLHQNSLNFPPKITSYIYLDERFSSRWVTSWRSERRKRKKRNSRELARLICFAPHFLRVIRPIPRAFVYRIPLYSPLTSSSCHVRSARALSPCVAEFLSRVDENRRGGLPSRRLNGGSSNGEGKRYSIFTRWRVLFDQVVTYR